ncbi:TPA: hypothetical protein QDB28_005229 [Burkholderia vietnamiensis]|uniref:hypothetical protein n=1 Tax=Burkholderia vietnamiensis TaxID=60552 RepID=UPI001589249E|nr:hypothetical protein [Burkholderia vietnamiensis]HDR9164794.1 hypothetical protein [Burkholderia vietnamiensis]
MQFDPQKRNNLILIDKSELRTYWHLVRPGLEFMFNEQRTGFDGWLPEDVFSMIANGTATLAFTSIMRGDDKGLRYQSREAAIADSSGFVVLIKRSSFSTTALHIWIAVSNDATNKADAGSIDRLIQPRCPRAVQASRLRAK